MRLEFVLYRSVTQGTLSPARMVKIIEKSDVNNARFGLTGFLHYENGLVLQYLEGPSRPLYDRLSVIASDRRHREFQIIAEGDLDERLFPNWMMGHLSLSDQTLNGQLCNMHWLENPPEDDVITMLQLISAAAGAGHTTQVDPLRA